MNYLYIMSSGDKEVKNDEIDLDQQHFLQTLASFKFFGLYMQKKLQRSLTYYNSLPEDHRCLAEEFELNTKKMETCIAHNDELLNRIINHSAPDIFNGEHACSLSSLLHTNEKENSKSKNGVVVKSGPFGFTSSDMDKVRSTLKQFVRDWSSLGASEREKCYQPVIDDVCSIFGKREKRSSVSILVPGAGLGRLAWELAHRGFNCQGNEWSLHMLIPAYFILNTCSQVNQHTIYPWVTQFCNNMSRDDQLAPVHFPDVSPSDLPAGIEFSMAAGDFVEIYTEPDTWDCVATVFFIDTAHNILSYLKTIWTILKPGGYWINCGPLLYHYTDIPGENSLELSYEEVRLAIQRLGFKIVKEKKGLQCGYTQNPESLLSYQYNCVYGVFRKPEADKTSGKGIDTGISKKKQINGTKK